MNKRQFYGDKGGRSAANMRIAGRLVRGAALVALLGLAACGNDRRISLAEFRVRQAIQLEKPPVSVEPELLGLVDFQPYGVRIGDVLGVQMIGLKPNDQYAITELHARVHSDGTIKLPVVPPIPVVGLTLGEVEERIMAAHLAAEIVKDLTVSVQLADIDGTTVVLVSPGKPPSLLRLKANQRNVMYALNEAGLLGPAGFGPVMASNRVILKPIRPEREEVVYDLNDINDVRRALMGPPLEPGDVVVVEPAQANVVYVNGMVNLPGAIPIPPGTTLSVLRALGAAGWIRPYITVKEGELVRRMPDGTQVLVELKLNEIIEGKEEDIALLPGDILRVPQTVGTFLQEWAIQNVLVGPFNISVRYDPLQQYNTDRAIAAENYYGGGSFSQGVKSALTTGLPQLLVPPVAPTPAP